MKDKKKKKDKDLDYEVKSFPLFDKFQKRLENYLIKLQSREDLRQLQRSLFWILLFPPYGIYILLFKTKISKVKKIIVGIITVLMLVLVIDISLYPNRVYDSVALKSYNKFAVEHDELNISEAREVYKKNHFKINDTMYFSFLVYDQKYMYYSIFEVEDYNKDYNIEYLYKVDFSEKPIYCSQDFKKYEDINPIVLDFLLSNSNMDFSFKPIKSIEDDLFFNFQNQDIIINGKMYTFEFTDMEVISIIEDKDEIYRIDEKLRYKLPYKPIYDILFKNFEDKYQIVGYNYIYGSHNLNIKFIDKEYVVEYIPGYGATLKSIDDKSLYINDLKRIYDLEDID